jgi:hypothetical protein
MRDLVVCGGVAANKAVRARLQDLADKEGLRAVYPPPRLCTDNGVMAAWAAIERLRLGCSDDPTDLEGPPAPPPAARRRGGGQLLESRADASPHAVRARWPLGVAHTPAPPADGTPGGSGGGRSGKPRSMKHTKIISTVAPAPAPQAPGSTGGGGA